MINISKNNITFNMLKTMTNLDKMILQRSKLKKSLYHTEFLRCIADIPYRMCAKENCIVCSRLKLDYFYVQYKTLKKRKKISRSKSRKKN